MFTKKIMFYKLFLESRIHDLKSQQYFDIFQSNM